LLRWEHEALFEDEIGRVGLHLELPVGVRLRVRAFLLDVALLANRNKHALLLSLQLKYVYIDIAKALSDDHFMCA